ncbi:MAG: hypothetical protein KDC44_24730, partial [Phaeodactylibacter sp.]|nr:hypothetical protein [Phaeodactylibacter sp.]
MRYFKYLLPLFALLLLLAFQSARPKLVLEGQKIAVSKEQPYAMTLELEAGEELGKSVTYEEGRAALEDVQVLFKEGEREIQRFTASSTRQNMRAEQNGFYQIVFEVDRRKLNLRFKLYSNKKRELETGVPTKLFVVTSGFLGVSDRTPESHATFAMPIPEGYSLTIQSNNPENIYYNYTTDQDGGSIQHWVSDNELFQPEETGNYSFRLYIDKPKDVSILNFKEFLRARKGLDVNDLTFVVTKPGTAGGAGGPGSGEDSDL